MSEEQTFNIDTAEIVFRRNNSANEALFLKMRAAIEQQAAVIRQYESKSKAKPEKAGTKEDK